MKLRAVQGVVLGAAIGLAVGLCAYTFAYAQGWSYLGESINFTRQGQIALRGGKSNAQRAQAASKQ